MFQSPITQEVVRIRHDDLLREAVSLRRVPVRTDRRPPRVELRHALRSLQLPELRDFSPPRPLVAPTA